MNQKYTLSTRDHRVVVVLINAPARSTNVMSIATNAKHFTSIFWTDVRLRSLVSMQ
jgi:hypothetical protein